MKEKSQLIESILESSRELIAAEHMRLFEDETECDNSLKQIRNTLEQSVRSLAKYTCKKYPPNLENRDIENVEPHIEYVYAESLDVIIEYIFKEDFQHNKDIDLSPNDFKRIRFITRSLIAFSTENTISAPMVMQSSEELIERKSRSLMTAVSKMYKIYNGIMTSSLLHSRYELTALDTIGNLLFLHARIDCGEAEVIEDEFIQEMKQYPYVDIPFDDYKKAAEYKPVLKVVVEEVNHIPVIRWVFKYKDKVFDHQRVYIKNREAYVYRRSTTGKWRRFYGDRKHHVMHSEDPVFEMIIRDVSDPYLKPCLNAIKEYECTNGKGVTILLSYIEDEKIEQFVKMGLIKDIAWFCQSYPRKPLIRHIETAVHSEENESSVYKFLGINKYQLKSIKNHTNQNLFKFVGIMRQIVHGSEALEIANLDNRTSDEIVRITENILSQSQQNVYIISVYIVAADYIRRICNNNEDDGNNFHWHNRYLAYLSKLNQLDEISEYQSYIMYKDFLKMVCFAGLLPHMTIFPKTKQDLEKWHDEINQVYTEMLERSRNKWFETRESDFEKSVKKYKKLEFTKKGEYSVIIPTKPIDLIKEGGALKHCVGSYIENVLDGKTKIVFVRKAEDLDKPFFTIEVDNNNVIQQAHGFCNSNVNTVNGLMDFIENWAKEKNLIISNINKIR